MPDLHAQDSSSPESPIDAAQVLEDAADLLLIRGVCRHEFGARPGGTRCAIGAIAEVMDVDPGSLFDIVAVPPMRALDEHLRLDVRLDQQFPRGTHTPIPAWNDRTRDDFEIIDTLRHVAKDLRNGAES